MKEKSTFIQTFGDSPAIRVLDFLLTGAEFDYPIKQIANEVSAGWTTVENVIAELIKIGIVEETRELGKAKMFKINKENPYAKALLKLDLELAMIAATQIESEEKIKIVA